MSSSLPSSADLGKSFVQSMRVLFDLMDDQQTGIVKYVDISRRWRKNDSNASDHGLPKGLLDCLRNVTTANGDLTFERFCAGMKICLLKNESEKSNEKVVSALNPNFLMSSKPVGGGHSLMGSGGAASVSVDDVIPPPKPPRMPLVDATGQLSRRREPRRHTLQNGIDYNRLKCLKQLEQEKNLIKEGLSTLSETQQWLTRKLEVVQERIRLVGRSSMPMEHGGQDQERLDLKRGQVSEINRHLMRLVHSWEHIDQNNVHFELNLETHLNSPEKLRQLKQDHYHLLEDLNSKQQLISKLEREKMIMMQELNRFH